MQGRGFDALCPFSGDQTRSAGRHGSLVSPEPFDPCHAPESAHPETSGAECPTGEAAALEFRFARERVRWTARPVARIGGPRGTSARKWRRNALELLEMRPRSKRSARNVRREKRRRWIPACAGMTALDGASGRPDREPERGIGPQMAPQRIGIARIGPAFRAACRRSASGPASLRSPHGPPRPPPPPCRGRRSGYRTGRP